MESVIKSAAKRETRTHSLWAPFATVFLASAVIMVIELVAGRLISRHLGMSLYTWTAVIGVMMAGMSLGNYIGGRLADRLAPERALAVLLLGGAGAVMALLPLNVFLGGLDALVALSWPARIFSHCTLLFVAPSMFLGAIPPVVARMALARSGAAGRAVGGVFAFSVLGSIVGTFLTGFWLVYLLGVTVILFICASALGLLAAPFAFRWRNARRFVCTAESSLAEATNVATVPMTPLWPHYATVFASNAAFMVLELAAARMLAREFGASLYTWTTIIAVVLAGVSLGNALGGRIADWRSTRGAVAAPFLLAALATIAAPVLAQAAVYNLNNVFVIMTLSWPAQILFYTALAFFLPCLFVGFISPIVVKRAIAGRSNAGRIVGAVYAWGAVGAIAGTFAAGYVLIAWMGALPLILAVALMLALMAAAYLPRNPLTWVVVLLAAAVLLLSVVPYPPAESIARGIGWRPARNAKAIHEEESQYSYIAVLQDPANPSSRTMLLDRLAHSQINLDDPTDLKYEYEWVYEAVIDKAYPQRRPIRALVIGGGGYAFPHYLEVARPGSAIEVAEIDPAVTQAAYEYFGLPRETTIAIHDMDARNRVADLVRNQFSGVETTPFDCIFGDSINDYSVPYHLTTYEFTKQISDLLHEDGLYLLNLIDVYDSGAFLSAVVRTCQSVFPYVYAFNTGRPARVRDTFVVVSSRRPLSMMDIAARIRERYPYAGNLLDPRAIDAISERHGNIVLTDDYAPVEVLLKPAVQTRRRDPGEARLDLARRRAAQGRTADAIAECRAALAIHAQWPDALAFLAELLEETGDTSGAYTALQEAVSCAPDPPRMRWRLAEFLLRQGRRDEGIAAVREAIAASPRLAGLLPDLAKTAATRGDTATQSECVRLMREHNVPVDETLLPAQPQQQTP